MALGDTFPTIKWRRQHLSNWHLQTSQTTGWGQAFTSIAIAIVTVLLQIFCGTGLFVGHWYSWAAVISALSMYKIGKVTYILFINPVPTKAEDPLDSSEVLQQSKERPLSLEEDVLYRHEELKPAAFTRLLILKPAWSESAELKGEIIQFLRGTPVYYQALSYVCGSDAVADCISIGDKKLPLTANCSVALRRLRHRVKARMIWVDSVCVDQKNLQEKIAQLRCMEMVYSYSAETLVWLGKESKGSLITFQYLRLAGLSLHMQSWISEWLMNRICRKILKRNHSHYVYDVYKRPWFHRVWTLQEIALSSPQRVRLLCGSYETNFEWIAWPLTQITASLSVAEPYIYDSSALFADFLLRATTRNSINHQKGGKVNLELGQLLVKLQDHEATEAKDRVYSLLAIFVKAGIYNFPQPTYGKSVGRIYWDATVTICNHEKALDLLLLLTEKRQNDMKNVPSWVPDFRVPGTPRRRLGLTFKATGNAWADFTFSFDQKKLHTTIYIIDTVATVSSHTVWQPRTTNDTTTTTTTTTSSDENSSATPNIRIEDSVIINLEEGFEQTITTLRDWLWLVIEASRDVNQHNHYKSSGSLNAFMELLLCGVTLVPDSRELFSSWLDLLMHEDPKLVNANPATTTRNAEILQDWLLEHAYPIQLLREKFFDHSAPFHHLTISNSNSQEEERRKIMWQIMCCFKTIPGIKETHHHIWSMTRGDGTRFFMTREEQFIGLGPSDVQVEDLIVLISGLKMPLVLRRCGDGSGGGSDGEEDGKETYEVVGVAYVQGLMDGVYWDEMMKRKRKKRSGSMILV